MRNIMVLTCLTVTASLGFVGCGPSSSQLNGHIGIRDLNADVPVFSKVMLIVFENTDYKKVMKQPFFAKAAREGANLENFYAETHPSQPNYIAMTAGDLYGVNDDSDVTVDARNIVDLLEEKGKTWKAYAENFPGNCSLVSEKGDYARKHVPFISFKNIQNNKERCAKIVEAAEFKQDLAAKRIPDYSYYAPNMKNDGHDTSVDYAGKWLEKTFGPLMSDRKIAEDLTLILTFDESSIFGGNHIYTVFWGKGVRAGATSGVEYDHYSMLKTIETGLGLGDLGKNDARASVIKGIWSSSPGR